MKYIATALIAMFLITGMYAQTESEYRDLVVLKNGSKLYGSLIDYKPGEALVLKLKNGSVLSFNDDYITKVEVYSGTVKSKTEYSFNTGAIYHSLGLKSIPGGSRYQEYPSLGLGFQYSIGYSFSNLFFLGAGLGVDHYNYGFDEVFFPVFIDFSSYFRKKPVSPFIRFQGGYSMIYSKNENLIDKAGGLMMNPAIGLKFQGKYGINYLFDIGLKYQDAKFTFFDQWRWGGTVNRELTFLRTTLRFGILF